MKRSSKMLQVFKKPVSINSKLYEADWRLAVNCLTSENNVDTLICWSNDMMAWDAKMPRKARNRMEFTLSKCDFLISRFIASCYRIAPESVFMNLQRKKRFFHHKIFALGKRFNYRFSLQLSSWRLQQFFISAL